MTHAKHSLAHNGLLVKGGWVMTTNQLTNQQTNKKQVRAGTYLRVQLQGQWVQTPAPHLTAGQVPRLPYASISSTVRWDKNSTYVLELFWQVNELTLERA